MNRAGFTSPFGYSRSSTVESMARKALQRGAQLGGVLRGRQAAPSMATDDTVMSLAMEPFPPFYMASIMMGSKPSLPLPTHSILTDYVPRANPLTAAALWCYATTHCLSSVPSESMLKAEATSESVKLPTTVHVWICSGLVAARTNPRKC